MHTSSCLQMENFQFWQHRAQGSTVRDFTTFCPDYHALDRVSVVSPTLEAGVLHTSHALLALTTAFYDSLRTRSTDFFDYPQHFAFVGASGADVHSGRGLLPPETPKLWHAWSWLDVWPDAKWVATPATASDMLRRVFDYQINRVFWPRSLKPGSNETPLPAYAWKMLRTHVKAVYYYDNTADNTAQNTQSPRADRVEIRLAPAVDAVVQESCALLPAGLATGQTTPNSQCYEPVDVDAFLATMTFQ